MFSRLAYVRVEWSDMLVPHKAAATFNDGLVISLQRKFGVDAWVELVEVFPFFVEVFLVGFFTVIGVVVDECGWIGGGGGFSLSCRKCDRCFVVVFF